MIAMRENDALGRIEAALARVENVLARPRSNDGLKRRHEQMCAAVSGALAELDDLIAAAEAQK